MCVVRAPLGSRSPMTCEVEQTGFVLSLRRRTQTLVEFIHIPVHEHEQECISAPVHLAHPHLAHAVGACCVGGSRRCTIPYHTILAMFMFVSSA
jgi:hypothetical protein